MHRISLFVPLAFLFLCPPNLYGQEPTPTPSDSVHAPTATDSLQADTAAAAADSAAAAARKKAKEEARAAAEAWLSLTDAGKFDESWKAAAATLREGVSRTHWMTQGTRARRRLDTLQSRRLTATQYRDSTAERSSGAPTVVLQYATEYEGGSTLEAVIAAKEDTTWKVAGYRVVPAPASDTSREDS